MFYFKNLVSKLLFILLIALVLITSQTGYAADKYIVRMIYFKSQESPPVDHDKYDKIMRDMQDFFRKEMIRHGYEDKTFKYEKDNEGKLKIHSFTAKHPAEHYTGEVFLAWYEKISKEIPFHLNSATNRDEQENIYIIIYGGIPIIGDGRGSPDGGSWTFSGTATGGSCAINENYGQPKRYEGLIAHEFAHTFGLKHNHDNKSLLGTTPLGGPSHLLEHEACVLNIHHMFNGEPHITNTRPEISDELKMKSNLLTYVTFELHVKSKNAELYHAQISYAQDYLDSAKLEGRDDIIEFKVNRNLIFNRNIVFLDVSVWDSNGNRSKKRFNDVVIPVFIPPKNKNPDLNIPEEPEKEEDDDDEQIDEKDDEQEPRNVTPKSKLTTSWAKMKARY